MPSNSEYARPTSKIFPGLITEVFVVAEILFL